MTIKSIGLFLLFVSCLGCHQQKTGLPASNPPLHLLKSDNESKIPAEITKVDHWKDADYISIESEGPLKISPDYSSGTSNYRAVDKPTFYTISPILCFSDTAQASSTITSPSPVSGSWPGWKPHIPTQKGKTKFELDYLGEENGLKSIFNTIRSITQDDFGNIWLGTLSSVYKYDGIGLSLFSKEEGLEKKVVSALLADQNGNIWIGQNGAVRDSTEGNLYRWNGDHFDRFTTEEGLSSNYITALLETQSGDIWIGTTLGIDIWDGTSLEHFTVENGFTFPVITDLLEDTHGRIWIGTKRGLYYWEEDNFYSFGPAGAWNNAFINDLVEDQQGRIWVATEQGVFQWTGNGFLHFDQQTGLQDNLIYSVGEADNGNIWIGNSQYDIWDGSGFRTYTIEDGFKSENAMDMFRDATGNLWLIHHYGYGASILKRGGFIDMTPPFYADKYNTDSYLYADQDGKMLVGNFGKGLHVWDGKGYVHYSSDNGFTNEAIKMLQDRDKNWWIGSDKALWVFREDTIKQYDLLPTALMEDDRGNVWIGSRDAFYIWDGIGFKRFSTEQGFNGKGVSKIMQAQDGTIWIATWYSGLFQFTGDSLLHYPLKSGEEMVPIFHLTEDREGNIWIGTYDDGLYQWDGQLFTRFGEREGLTDDRIAGIKLDTLGFIWVGTYSGLNRLENLPRKKELALEKFGLEDGLLEMSITDLEIDQEDNLWVATTSTISKAQLSSLRPDPNSRANIQLEEVRPFFSDTDWRKTLDSITMGGKVPVVGEKGISLSKVAFDSVRRFSNVPFEPSFPYTINQLTFRWSAIDWSAPHQLQYSYLLEGQDDGWSPLVESSQVTFRDLRPGDYTFSVRAVGMGGNWSNTSSFSFQVRPPVWATLWAKLFYLILIVGAIILSYRYQLQRKLEQSEAKRIKEVDALKTRLYTNVTHEFRTPLTVIQGMADQLSGNEEAKELIRRNSKNLLHLVNQLLDMSKIESNKMDLTLRQGDIIAFLRYLTKSLKSYADSKKIELDFSSDFPQLIVEYDTEKIQHIISNLLSNAIKFTPEEGRVELHIASEPILPATPDDVRLQIRIRDNGEGIRKEDLPYIFDRFYQVAETQSRQGKGTGIGLALAKELVELMDGSIAVESEWKKGSEFTVLLPLKKAADQTKNAPAEEYPDLLPEEIIISSSSFQLNKNKTVPASNHKNLPLLLIIEDNLDVIAYIKTCLRDHYHIHTAINGQAGIDAALEIIPDIIISDVMMPEKDGYGVTEFLKNDERTSHIPIILLTAKADASSKLEGLKRGADAYLAKPFDQTELMVRLEKLVELRQKLQNRYQNPIPPIPSKDPNLQLEDVFLSKVREEVYGHLDDAHFGVAELCKRLGMSQSQLFRKIKALTGKSIAAHIRSIRLYRGYELLQTTSMNVSEVAYEIGFTDPNYFSKTFTKEFDILPSKVEKRL